MSEKYSMKDHMAAHHQGAAEHHTAMAECEMAKCQLHGDLSAAHEEAEPEIAKLHKGLAKTCKAMAGHHTAEANRHGDMMKAAQSIQKSMGSQLAENRGFGIEGIRGIVPPNPTITPVPRTGQREMTKAMAVDPEFESLVSLDMDSDL